LWQSLEYTRTLIGAGAEAAVAVCVLCSTQGVTDVWFGVAIDMIVCFILLAQPSTRCQPDGSQ
jgi:hypothetical protein